MTKDTAKQILTELSKEYFRATNSFAFDEMNDKAEYIKLKTKHEFEKLPGKQRIALYTSAINEFNEIFSSTHEVYTAKELERHNLAQIKLILLDTIVSYKQKEEATKRAGIYHTAEKER